MTFLLNYPTQPRAPPGVGVSREDQIILLASNMENQLANVFDVEVTYDVIVIPILNLCFLCHCIWRTEWRFLSGLFHCIDYIGHILYHCCWYYSYYDQNYFDSLVVIMIVIIIIIIFVIIIIMIVIIVIMIVIMMIW